MTTGMAALFDLDWQRIVRALPGRERYKYVQPRVEREGTGWKIVSPNCSRNIDPEGGEIDIAWFEPDTQAATQGRWRLHARDHAAARWVLSRSDVTLPQAIALVCTDTQRTYWR
jgi:hypothetical protein